MQRALSVAIAGASRGLGEALAYLHAGRGVRLSLAARTPDQLARVASKCRERGADAEASPCDICDPAAVAAWMARVEAAGPIDILYVNAGAFGGRDQADSLETPAETAALLRVNLEGAIHVAHAGAEVMRRQRHGHLVLVSSLAAAHPLADAPVYSASKAGLRAYGEAMRERLAPSGVKVTVALPGHFQSEQTRMQVGELPLLMTAEAAARRIHRGVLAGRSEVAFPLPLVWLIAAGRLLPWRVRAFLGRSQRFHVRPPIDPDKAAGT